MMKTRERKSWIALPAILLLFAACKGETPTAPSPGGGGGGGQTPTQNATLVLAASDTTPLINTTVTVTATVTLNGTPVPNGTAVEFTTTHGIFADTLSQATLRTTTNGVATVSLTATTAGLARVQAFVTNVSRSIDITFGVEAPCVPPDPDCPEPEPQPTITSVDPPIGRPTGGERIFINGTNFIAPVRVLFEIDGQLPVEAFVVSVTPTRIEVISPAVQINAGQQIPADIIVITEVGSGDEERAEAEDAFLYRNVALVPVIFTVTPNSGPINGGTRVTIMGEGFQAPVQVLFGAAEARVIEVQFNQILVEAPEARETSPDGSDTVTGPVDVTVVNINSNERTTRAGAYRYIDAIRITAITPLFGSAAGGTDITIDGFGFDSPLQVLVAGVEALVIRVSGTQLLVRTRSLPSACTSTAGPVTVTNIENGDTAASPQDFQYVGVDPLITQIVTTGTLPIEPGETIIVTVDDPGTGPLGVGNIRFSVLDRTIIPSPSQVTDPSTPQGFTFALPLSGFNFPTVACTIPGPPPAQGTQLGPVDVPVTFINTTTGCNDTATITVSPPGPNTCVQAPPIAAQTAPTAGNCASAGTVTVGNSGQALITFRNTAAAGAQTLTVTPGTPSGPNASEFAVTPASHSMTPQQSQTFQVTFTPAGTNTRSASVVFTTNDPANPTFTVCLTGVGAP